ncbi:unnamed protein product [Miscanthus lutarioriparius]|uniref:Uncharacterized protein n=1 Tax=Miscanthus lutarioriparius TaxID=422564 RepID=A0A811N2S4_9POAL|nr:unnamed protein product [Miscanthus lutarioriparius]
MAVYNAREKAEKTYRLAAAAEELFLAGKIHDAHRKAKKAKRFCPSLPGVDNALTVYEVRVRVAARGGNGGWRAILGIGPGAAVAAAAAMHDTV